MKCKRIIRFVLLSLFSSPCVMAQIITNADGSALMTRYCNENQIFPIKGEPSGGTFSGCGISQQDGVWYFNPVVAAEQTVIFPYECLISYQVDNNTVATSWMLIYKPVVITPPMQDIATCDGSFELSIGTSYTGYYQYEWYPPGPIHNPEASSTTGYIESTQTFIVTARDVSSGCTGSDTVTVIRHPIPEVQVVQDSINISAREKVQLEAGGADHYVWSPSLWLSDAGTARPFAAPEIPITYQVVGFNEFGCSDTATLHIHIHEDLFVPNAFSPNGDGLNDVFKVTNFGYQRIEAYKIFNRWGQLVYQTADGSNGWDGTFKGRQADVGTYYYLIGVRSRDGNYQEFRGDVHLVR